MKTYTVPVFLWVRAKDKQEAIEKALEFMENALDAGYYSDIFPYCDIGLEHEVIEQEEPK